MVIVALHDHCPLPDLFDLLCWEELKQQVYLVEIEFFEGRLNQLFIGQILPDGFFVIRPKPAYRNQLICDLFPNTHIAKIIKTNLITACCSDLLQAILVPRLCGTMVSAYVATSDYVCS